jgi:hypothetical protein
MATRKKSRSVVVPLTAVAGLATDVSDMTGMAMQLKFSGTATYQAEQSFDGVNFVSLGTALTASGVVNVAPSDAANKVRWNCTVATSPSAASSVVAGVKQDDPQY